MKSPSFKAQHGRQPIAGRDFNPEGSLCQDDHEYLTGTGHYSDDVHYKECPQCHHQIMKYTSETLENAVYSGEYIDEGQPEIVTETHTRWMCECEYCGYGDAGYD